MSAGRFSGLTEHEAALRLQRYGPNELTVTRGRSMPRIIAETMREPMFLLLIGAALIYLALGDLAEGLFLLGGAVATVGLVIFQETRSERALAALRELAEPQARIIRGGLERTAPARELVPGDLLLVGEGGRLPADGVLIAGDVLSVDESALTGESAPVEKQAAGGAQEQPAPGADGGGLLFAGTVVVRGQGVVSVSHTGARSALGRIGASLATIRHEPTPLQQTAGRLVSRLGVAALGFCGLVALAYGLLRGEWVGGALAGVTVAIALIPEEFPMVLAVFLAIGAWRLARHHVLVRRSAVIETLGAATTLCVDKTGTLTENRMAVVRVWTPDGDVDTASGEITDAAAARLLSLAALASAPRAVDPMDRAVHARAPGAREQMGLDAEAAPERAWPLRAELLAVVQLWRAPDGRAIAAAKGAPEAIFRLCRLGPAETAHLQTLVRGYADQGLRVLGVASAAALGDSEEPLESEFDFAGLIGFLDPLRADVPAALAEAVGAGVKIVMITGDHPATALAIARGAGIDIHAGVLTGADLAALSLDELQGRLRTVRVAARIQPEQKLKIVDALKAAGEVVAMTGDGVNDAPALEAAHIGVAMGKRGADVAREAADLVILDDSFASIVGGVRLGRRIFANLRRALVYIVAVHVPVAGVALAPILLGAPALLYPLHVVLLELIIDPTCSLVFEAEPSEASAMRKPPRRRDEPLFGAGQILLAMVQGVSLLAGVLGLYFWSLRRISEGEARGVAFVTLVVGNLVLALTDVAASRRLFAPGRRLYWGMAGGVSLVLAAMLAWQPLGDLFAISRPSPSMLLTALVGGVVCGGWTALLRLRLERRSDRTPHAAARPPPATKSDAKLARRP